MQMEDTICALSTPPGMGAIAVIRLSGPEALPLFSRVFVPKNENRWQEAAGYSLHYGRLTDGEEILDDVMAGLYRQPHSYTGEDTVEINCHGSVYIQGRILRLLQKEGARLAEPGEYTLRAYLRGKLDLSQAEAVADLIASESQAAHQVALQQMRGGFSREIGALREQLIEFASLVELELDFGEEDVEFADREKLMTLLHEIDNVIQRLLKSYGTGNVLKKGVPVAIVGAPNAGKSTLLNALLQEEKAIVTEVAGTTRDAIEDVVNLEGVPFRFIDTAGIRATADQVEKIGIERTFQKIAQSRIVLYLFDAATLLERPAVIVREIEELRQHTGDKSLLILANKIDAQDPEAVRQKLSGQGDYLLISALQHTGLEQLQERLLREVDLSALHNNQSIVTNERHYRALQQSQEALRQVRQGVESGRSGDLLALDIRQVLHHLGSIIGQVEVDRDILGAIFGKFCIGK